MYYYFVNYLEKINVVHQIGSGSGQLLDTHMKISGSAAVW